MNVKFTDAEKKELKRMAALQLAECEDSSSTPKIYLWAEETPEEVEIPLSEYDEYKDDISTVEYDCVSCNSITALVAYHLEIGLLTPMESDIKKYNRKAKENGLPQFVSYETAMTEGKILGTDKEINGLADYLMVYGLDPDEVVINKHGNEMTVKATSFTRKEIEETQKLGSSLEFFPDGFLTEVASTGSSAVLMKMLLKCGTQLLKEETYGLKCTATSHLAEEEVLERYAKTPGEEFCASAFELTLPAQMTASGVEELATLKVFASGRVYNWGNQQRTKAAMRVVFSSNGEEKECKWPFSKDSTGASLKEQSKLVKLVNYVRYFE